MNSGYVSRQFFIRFALAASVLFAAAPAMAQSAEDYYKNKTVRIVVGYGPGGGYDTYARLIAPYLSTALGTSVVVENQPGAGGITALNRIMTAPPDGLQLMIVNGLGASLGQLTEQPGVRYDLARLSHLGTVSASPWVWLTGVNSTIDTPQKALAAHKRFNWSASGPIDGLSDGAAFSCEALKLDCRIVMGYPGSNEAALAVAKGEMDMIYVSDTSANNYVKSGQNKALATMGRHKSRFFPDTPTIFESVKLDADQAEIFDFHSTAEDLGRILVAPPGIPADRLAVLRNAVKQALSDPTIIAEGERTQRYIDFIDAEKTRVATVKVVSDVTPEQKKQVVDILAKAAQK